MRRKFVSLLLVVVLIASMLPMGASASGSTYVGFWNENIRWEVGDYLIDNGKVYECLSATGPNVASPGGTASPGVASPGGTATPGNTAVWNYVCDESKLFVDSANATIVAAIPNFDRAVPGILGAIVKAEDGKYYKKIVRDGDPNGGWTQSPLDPELGYGHWALYYEPAAVALTEVYVGFWNDNRVWSSGEYAIHNEEVWKCIGTTTIGGSQFPGSNYGFWAGSAWNNEQPICDEADLFDTLESLGLKPMDFSRTIKWPEGAIVEAEDGKYYKALLEGDSDSWCTGPLDSWATGWWELYYDPDNAPAALPHVGIWNDNIVWSPGNYAVYGGKVWQCIAMTHISGGEAPGTNWGYWGNPTDQPICDEAELLNYVTLSRWHYDRDWPEGALVRHDSKIYTSNEYIANGDQGRPDAVNSKWTDVTASFDPSNIQSKDLAVYFAQWGTQSVKDLPWDRLTTINHSFWKIEPGTYEIVSADPDPAVDETHFINYGAMYSKYPNADVMVSVGGWTKSGYFSEMASTQANRTKFIESCIETLDAYPWLGGIDLDWEYPGVQRSGDDSGDEGNPARPEDGRNYTLLLQEMRAAFNSNGHSDKKITVCAPANPNNIVSKTGQVNQEIVEIAAVVDRINIMTYDMTGSFDSTTGHHSNLNPSSLTEFSVKRIVDYYKDAGVVDTSVLNIGSPLYSRGWTGVVANDAKSALGAAGKGGAPEYTWAQLKRLEVSIGYETGYDAAAEAAYIYSKEKGQFFSYENERSLEAKLDYINDEDLGGLIVWETNGDSKAWDFPMLSQMAQGLGIWNGTISDYTPEPMGAYYVGYWHDERTWYPGDYAIYDGKVWECAAVTTIGGNEFPGSNFGYWTGPGLWNAELPVCNEADLMSYVVIPEWMDDRGYPEGALVLWQSKVYKCIAETNMGDPNPATDAAAWELTEFGASTDTPSTDTPSTGTTTTSSSGKGGSSSGGSSATTPTPLNNAQAVRDVGAAIAAAKSNPNSNTATVTFKNVSSVSLSTLKEMSKAAGNTPLKVNADSLNPDGSVDVRITLDPSKATAGISLLGSTSSQAVAMTFNKYFSNELAVVSLSQKGSFGMEVSIAAKISDKLNKDKLVFYAYDKATNKFQKLTDVKYWVDSKGYVHFNTSVGGDIIISDGPLARK